MTDDNSGDARDDAGVCIFTPTAILPGWEPGEPTEEYYELHKGDFEEIGGSVKHPDTDVVYQQALDGVGPYGEQHHETDLVAISHARESYLADTEDDFDAIRLPCFDEPGIDVARESSDTLALSTPSASLHVASMLDGNIGIVISGASAGDTNVLRSIVKKYVLENRVASIRPTGFTPTEMHVGLLSESEHREMNEVALAEAERAIDDGADVIIGYSGAHEHLEANLDVPM